MCWRREGVTQAETARRLRRSESIVSRELGCNSCIRLYRASTAQRRYGERREGCRRRPKGHTDERRGRFAVPARIDERPAAAEGRSEAGHWESYTVAGTPGGACIVTNVDRMSGFGMGGRAATKTKREVGRVMAAAFRAHPAKTCTPDCGKEFAGWADVARECVVESCFAYPRHPWGRGSNESFNGLLRECFPKGRSLDGVSTPRCRRPLAN